MTVDIIDAIKERRSTRAFRPDPIDRKTIETLLTLASRAPSAINLQPWEFTVVSGEEKSRLSRLLVKRMRERQISCGPGAKDRLPDRLHQRQRALLERMLPNLPEGVAFQDFINEGSCDFYGAPTAIIITLDQVFSSARLTDIGIALGYLLLAAHALGLGTCPVGLITAFDDDIKEALSLPQERQVVIGVAIGYADPDAGVNRSRSERAPLEELVRWRQ
jgi:nitroreductase